MLCHSICDPHPDYNQIVRAGPARCLPDACQSASRAAHQAQNMTSGKPLAPQEKHSLTSVAEARSRRSITLFFIASHESFSAIQHAVHRFHFLNPFHSSPRRSNI